MDEIDKLEIKTYQKLINTGAAWTLEGSVGRQAMALIEAGFCCLGPEGHRDYWGNYVPSRYEVKPGTKGSVPYCKAKQAAREGTAQYTPLEV